MKKNIYSRRTNKLTTHPIRRLLLLVVFNLRRVAGFLRFPQNHIVSSFFTQYFFFIFHVENNYNCFVLALFAVVSVYFFLFIGFNTEKSFIIAMDIEENILLQYNCSE